MRIFSKSEKLNDVCYDVRGPVLDEAELMEKNGIDICKLNIGNPAPFGFHAPDEIIEEMGKNLRNAQGYSASKGILSAREAIVEYCDRKGFPKINVDDVYMGNGVSELILLSVQALLNDGDEILIPAPDYPLWTASVKLAGGNPVHYVCDERAEWYPDVDDIRNKVTPRTKGIVIINPNNPTGALYPKEVLLDIIQIAREHELILFSDEIYDRMLFDGQIHTSVATLARDVFVVTFNGLSKSHQIAGFRCGWMVLSGNRDRVKGYIEGINMLSSMRLCSNVPSQYVIQTALKGKGGDDSQILPSGRLHVQREYICNEINDIPGLSVVKPKAAFYAFPKIDVKKFAIKDDERFVLDFLKKEHVLLVHGRGFNLSEPDHFRIVFLPEVGKLKWVMERMRRFLSGYRQS